MTRQIELEPTTPVHVPFGDHRLNGDLVIPVNAQGIVLLAHESAPSRESSRNQYVASVLQQRDVATLLIDLLTPEEEAINGRTAEYRFHIPILANRLVTIVDWLRGRTATAALRIGLFGTGTGGSAALIAAAERPREIGAVVSRGGHPDLAVLSLAKVVAPTLLIVGEFDAPVIETNRYAMKQMNTEVALEIVPGATHLFVEPGTLERVAELTATWFTRYLRSI